MEISHIKETCLYITNLQSAVTFYKEILGFQLYAYSIGRHAFFKVGNTMLLCFNPEESKIKTSPPAHFAEGRQHIAFEVSAANYYSTKSSIINKGIEVIDEIIWTNGQKSFYFEDPGGNILEIVPSGIWESDGF